MSLSVVMSDSDCDNNACYFFGFIGVAASIVFASMVLNNYNSIVIDIMLICSHFICLFLFFCFFLYRSWSSIWNSKIWCWYCINGCNESTIDNEKHDPNYYGWCFGYLWINYFSYFIRKQFSISIIFC